DRSTWQGVACPGANNRTGKHCLLTDDTGAVATLCPPGQKVDSFTGRCASDETTFDALALGAVGRVNALSAGLALPMAQTFIGSAAMIQLVERDLDVNGDGRITFDELLDADLFA